jgi:hypothetical protein
VRHEKGNTNIGPNAHGQRTDQYHYGTEANIKRNECLGQSEFLHISKSTEKKNPPSVHSDLLGGAVRKKEKVPMIPETLLNHN